MCDLERGARIMNYVLSCAPIISPVVFHLIGAGKDVTVVTSSEDVKRCCIALKIKFLHFETISPSFRSTKRPIALIGRVIKYLHDVISLKNRLDIVVKSINLQEGDNFHLLTRLIGYDNFYLAKELSKRRSGTVYFSGINWLPPRIHKLKFNWAACRLLFLKYSLKMLLGIDIMFYEEGSAPFLGIDDKFLTKNNIVRITHEKDFLDFMLEVVTANKNGHRRYDNLMVGEGGGITDRITHDSIKNAFKYLAALPVEIVIKKHPKHSDAETEIDLLFEEYFGNCEQLPAYIPAEFYLRNVNKNVISVSSTPLIVASHLKHLKAISLLDLVEWTNEAHKNEKKRDLIEMSRNKIIFPQDFEDLRQILIS